MKFTFSGILISTIALCSLNVHAETPKDTSSQEDLLQEELRKEEPLEDELVEDELTEEELLEETPEEFIESDEFIEEDNQEAALLPPKARQGYWLSVGGALGLTLNDSEERKSPENQLGGLLNFQLGEMVTSWLGIGLQANFGWAEDDQWNTLYGGLLLDIQLVPIDHLAIHFGAGGGGLRSTHKTDEETPLQGTGGGYYMLGLSYDAFPLYKEGSSGGFSATPSIQLLHLPGTTFKSTIVTVGLNVTWWSGLDKNKLDLSIEEAYSND